MGLQGGHGSRGSEGAKEVGDAITKGNVEYWACVSQTRCILLISMLPLKNWGHASKVLQIK